MTSKLVLVSLAVVVLSCGAIGTTAQAAPIVLYTDRAAFMAATSNLTNITFEGLAPVGGSANYSTPSGLTLSGVNFTGPTREEGFLVYTLVVINRPNSAFDYNSGAVLFGPTTTIPSISGITATLPGGVTAVGSDVMTAFAPLGQTVIVTLADGIQETFAATTFERPERGFIGFTSTSPILSIRFRTSLNMSSGNTNPLLDNFIFGQASPAAVPEPTTIMLLGIGIAGVAARHRHRKY